ncbi:MAG: hypothetical protein OXD40_13020 [bacterium]|nr:hypothetical protein [bacterium]
MEKRKATERPARQRKPGLKADYRGATPGLVGLAVPRYRPAAKMRPFKRRVSQKEMV